MSVGVLCPKCQKRLRVKEWLVGKWVRCPGCGSPVQVRASPQPDSTAPQDNTVTATDIAVLPAQPSPSGATSHPPRSEPRATEAGATARAAPHPPQPRADASAPSPKAAPQTAAASPAREDRATLAREILSAFQGPIAPIELSKTYQFAVVLVTLLMILLPLVYVGMIAGLGWLLYWHARFNTFLLHSEGSDHGQFSAVLVYAGPLVAGGILLVFMLKPLFARAAKEPPTRSLDRKNEPLLFAFVDRLCEVVNAPKPARIDVNCDINASASLRRGIWSLFRDDLVLTLGLPLVAGLNLQQLAGVLAHEFGHFTQDTAMGASYVLRRMSWWFTRVVYERDVWDQRLYDWSHRLDLRIGWIFYLARLGVWLTRRILWCLMMLGHLVSGFLLRQMELDADRHEARVAGSETFAQTARQLRLLGVAYQGALADLWEFSKEGRLSDNLPLLIVANVAQIPAQLQAAIDTEMHEANTGLFDTHPCDRDRIANARHEAARGVFHSDRPAGVLFADFRALARAATVDFYREVLGEQFREESLRATEDLVAAQEQTRQETKALVRYFQGQWDFHRPWAMPDTRIGAPREPARAVAVLKHARQKMLECLPAYREHAQSYRNALEQRCESQEALALTEWGFRPPKDAYRVPMPDREAVERCCQSAAQQILELVSRLEPFEEMAVKRLWAALALLHVPRVAARVPDAPARQREIAAMLPVLAALADSRDALVELYVAGSVLAVLLAQLEGVDPANSPFLGPAFTQTGRLLKRIEEVRARFASLTYPFAHAKPNLAVAEYLLEKVPPSNEPDAVLGAAREILDSVSTLWTRIGGRLASVAEKVESVLGLPPLPDLPEEIDAKQQDAPAKPS